MTNIVVETYSALADTYDGTDNARSCWGTDTERIINLFRPRPSDRTIADIGCGAGGALLAMARKTSKDTRFIGVEPADNLRARAAELTRDFPNIEYRRGAFEDMPLDNDSIDCMVSINAFHWCPDVVTAVKEIRRVLRKDGALDLFFIGRNMGREFIRATTPVFLKYMGPKALLEATVMRQHLTVETTTKLFAEEFRDQVKVIESYITYYDTVEGHLGWWVRIAPQLVHIPEEKRADFDKDIKKALSKLGTPEGIPYTMHTLRVHKC